MQSSATKSWYAFVAQLFLLAWCFVFLIGGSLIAHIGYCDPDTCWLLATGRWICGHGALPMHDPFSSNPPAFAFMPPNLPLFNHEWLSSIFMFLAFQLGGLLGPLILTTLVTGVAFVWLPGLLLRRSGTGPFLSFVVLVLGYAAAAFRFWARPEIFTFLFLAVLIYINDVAQRCPQDSRRFRLCCLFLVLLAAVWVNCHALFVLSIGYLIAYSGLQFIARLLGDQNEFSWMRNIKLWLSIGMGALCSPWGLLYWPAIVAMATSPVNSMVSEYSSVTGADLANPTFIALLLFLAAVLATLLGSILKNKLTFNKLILPAGLIVIALVACFTRRRLTPVAVLLCLAAVGEISRLAKSSTSDAAASSTNWSSGLARLGFPGGSACSGVALACALGGCIASAMWLQTLVLPAASITFDPPYKVMEFLAKTRPAGRMLNDLQFGSMMIWQMKGSPDVFIDGRDDSRYDRQLVYDFQIMRLCRPGWQDLLRHYGIDWIVFPSDSQIARNLSHDPRWHVQYSDKQAAVIVRLRSAGK